MGLGMGYEPVLERYIGFFAYCTLVYLMCTGFSKRYAGFGKRYIGFFAYCT